LEAVAVASAIPPRGLTARQAELLVFCIEKGYYRIPRHVTLRQLAAAQGISSVSLSLTLRRAEALIIQQYAAGLPRPP
jgi:predicted DNA binding protein